MFRNIILDFNEYLAVSPLTTTLLGDLFQPDILSINCT